MERAQSEQLIAKGTKKTSVAKSDRDLLYGLYKQATAGNAPKRSSLFSRLFPRKSKKKAWQNLQNIPEEILEKAFAHIHKALDILKVENGPSSPLRNALPEGGNLRSPPVRADSSTLLTGARGKLTPTAEEPSAVSSSSSQGETAEESEMSPEDMLLVAAGEDDVPTIKALLDRGAAIDHGDECGQTALHMAADHGSMNALRLLIERGANISAADQHGVSVLQAAVIAGHVNICKVLLEHGADPNQYDEDGDSPKMCAMDDGSPEMQDLFDDDDDEEEENESHIEQESTISWATEFTMPQVNSPHKIIDRIPSILDK